MDKPPAPTSAAGPICGENSREFEEKYPRKAARIRNGISLVVVSARAGCAINTASRYEVAPDTVRGDKRAALDAVYDTFLRSGVAA